MKKLIISAIAATALLFGFASCSGDLHDASEISLKGGACPGAMNGWTNTTAWTKEDGNVYTYEFTAGSTEAEWKCIATAGNWNSGAFGGGKDKITETPVGKTTVLTYDEATGGNKNAKITGMEIGSEYRITVTVNVLEASANIECIKAVPKANIIIKDSDGNISNKDMTPVNGGYSYLIKAEEAGSVDFQVCISNMLYYSEGSEIEVGFNEVESAIFKCSDEYTTFKYEKGEYLIFVGTDYSNFGTVKLQAKYAALLKSAFFAINGPMGIKPLVDNGDGSYSVEFVAEEKAWGAGDGEMNFTLYGQSTEKEMNDPDNWWNGTSFRGGGFDCEIGTRKTVESNGDNITLKNIENGATYKATFTSDAENIYILVEKK